MSFEKLVSTENAEKLVENARFRRTAYDKRPTTIFIFVLLNSC